MGNYINLSRPPISPPVLHPMNATDILEIISNKLITCEEAKTIPILMNSEVSKKDGKEYFLGETFLQDIDKVLAILEKCGSVKLVKIFADYWFEPVDTFVEEKGCIVKLCNSKNEIIDFYENAKVKHKQIVKNYKYEKYEEDP